MSYEILSQWLTSIQGTESQILYKTFGNLFSESAKAGSLDKCVNDEFARSLFELGDQETKLPLSYEERRLEDAFLRYV